MAREMFSMKRFLAIAALMVAWSCAGGGTPASSRDGWDSDDSMLVADVGSETIDADVRSALDVADSRLDGEPGDGSFSEIDRE